MQCLEVSGVVQPLQGSLGVKGLMEHLRHISVQVYNLQGEQNARFKNQLPMESCY